MFTTFILSILLIAGGTILIFMSIPWMTFANIHWFLIIGAGLIGMAVYLLTNKYRH